MVPQLSRAGHVERGQPNLIFLHGVLTLEELVTAIKPWQWVLLTIECREVQFVKSRDTAASSVVAIDHRARNDGRVLVGGVHIDNRGG